MRRKGLYALVLSAIFIGMTAGSAAATLWAVPAGSQPGSCYSGISPHISLAAGVGKVNVDFSVSWNGHYGAAWGVYQYGIWDDKNRIWLLFSHNSIVKLHNYDGLFTTVTYKVYISMGNTTLQEPQTPGHSIFTQVYVVTPYTIVTMKTKSHPFEKPHTTIVYNTQGELQADIPLEYSG